LRSTLRGERKITRYYVEKPRADEIQVVESAGARLVVRVGAG